MIKIQLIKGDTLNTNIPLTDDDIMVGEGRGRIVTALKDITKL